jgi:hypothetical protein
MKIIIDNNIRFLIKDNNEMINVSDGEIIQYTGVLYKKIIDSISDIAKIETSFVGQVETNRSNETGITGIYIKPLYLWNIMNYEWNKIDNYTSPKKKYFLYPHLLMLPGEYYNYHPLYYLDTCVNKSLDEFRNVNKYISLDDV